MFSLRNLGTAVALVAASAASARVTNFTEPHSGFSLGFGTAYKLINTMNDSDPVPELVPAGTEVAGSASPKNYLLKMGFFRDRARVGVEPYFLAIIGMAGDWTSTGVEGAGRSSFTGWGGGVNVAVHFAKWSRVRMSGRLDGQFLKQTLTIAFANTSASVDEGLRLSSTALTAGAGLQTDFWLGDLWVLSLAGGYRHGFPRTWGVSQAGSLFGVAQGGGTATNPLDGTPVKSDFGGFYAELGLKLAFF